MPSLQNLLDEPIASVKQREASTLLRLLAAHQNRIVLFGCGGLGRSAIAKLRSLAIEPLCLCDNNQSLWGKHFENLPVLSVPEAAARYGHDALFLIAVWNPHHWYGETAAQLRAAGARSLSTYAPIFWRFPHDFLQVYLLNDLPNKVYEAKSDILEAEKLWADQQSLQIYRANILWRALGTLDAMPARPPENSYFPQDIFTLIPNECVIDCGAFDGDTIRQVLDRYAADFSAIYSLEGDAVSFDKMTAFIATLPQPTKARIHLLHAAVGGTRTVVRFTSDGGTGSKMNDEQNPGIDVQCYPLDDLALDGPVTFLKMDIEGAEYDSLLGATRIIARDRPLLAICVYHLQHDLWRIPLLVHSMLPEHRLFLRAYEGDGFQTVLYAVPPSRSLPEAERAAAPNLSKPLDS